MEIGKLIEFKNWADDIYLNYCSGLSDEQVNHKFDDFNKSVSDLLLHLLIVYDEWYNLLINSEMNYSEYETEIPIFTIIERIKQFNKLLLEFTKKQDITQQYILQWQPTDNPVKTTAENILFNFVTHSAYHRGQLALMLRKLGFDKIEETDFNPYIYKMGQQ